jgi:hypothetical protein
MLTEGVTTGFTVMLTAVEDAVVEVKQVPPLMLMSQVIGCVLPAESVALVYVLELPLWTVVPLSLKV